MDTARVVVKSMPVTITAVGTAEALSTVQIRAQTTGQLSQIHFAEGQDVRKGQPLFTLDPRPFQASLQQAQAVLARDTAQADQADAERGRYEDLFKRGLIPRDQDEAQAASATALRATVAADRAQIDQATLNLQYTSITAPIDGRTGALMAHVGDLVRANDTIPLVTINQLAPIYVTFSVPSRVLPDIQRRQADKALAVTAGAAEGTLTFIDNAVDPTTGTIKLKATFPNRDHALWPGAFEQTSIRLSMDDNAIVVPAVAVQPSQQGQYVYVVNADRTVQTRNVSVDRQQGGEVVIARGLAAGEEVVTDGQLRLTPGAHVETRHARDVGSSAATP